MKENPNIEYNEETTKSESKLKGKNCRKSGYFRYLAMSRSSKVVTLVKRYRHPNYKIAINSICSIQLKFHIRINCPSILTYAKRLT